MFYYAQDELGSVTGLISTGGTVANRYRYTPWGEYEPGTTETVYNPQRFGGSLYDATPRLYFIRARYYDPELARFISEDPTGIDGGMNLYAYAGNNPVNFRDPYGLEPCTPVFDNKQLVGFAGDCYEEVKVNVRKGGGGGTVYVGGSGRGGSWYRPTRGGGITLAQLLAGAKSGADRFFTGGDLLCGHAQADPNYCIVAATLPDFIGMPQGAAAKGAKFFSDFAKPGAFGQATRQIGRFSQFRVSIPGRVSGSYTEWVKTVNGAGRTVSLYHDTYFGRRFINRGVKVPGPARHVP